MGGNFKNRKTRTGGKRKKDREVNLGKRKRMRTIFRKGLPVEKGIEPHLVKEYRYVFKKADIQANRDPGKPVEKFGPSAGLKPVTEGPIPEADYVFGDELDDMSALECKRTIWSGESQLQKKGYKLVNKFGGRVVTRGKIKNLKTGRYHNPSKIRIKPKRFSRVYLVDVVALDVGYRKTAELLGSRAGTLYPSPTALPLPSATDFDPDPRGTEGKGTGQAARGLDNRLASRPKVDAPSAHASRKGSAVDRTVAKTSASQVNTGGQGPGVQKRASSTLSDVNRAADKLAHRITVVADGVQILFGLRKVLSGQARVDDYINLGIDVIGFFSGPKVTPMLIYGQIWVGIFAAIKQPPDPKIIAKNIALRIHDQPPDQKQLYGGYHLAGAFDGSLQGYRTDLHHKYGGRPISNARDIIKISEAIIVQKAVVFGAYFSHYSNIGNNNFNLVPNDTVPKYVVRHIHEERWRGGFEQGQGGGRWPRGLPEYWEFAMGPASGKRRGMDWELYDKIKRVKTNLRGRGLRRGTRELSEFEKAYIQLGRLHLKLDDAVYWS